MCHFDVFIYDKNLLNCHLHNILCICSKTSQNAIFDIFMCQKPVIILFLWHFTRTYKNIVFMASAKKTCQDIILDIFETFVKNLFVIFDILICANNM